MSNANTETTTAVETTTAAVVAPKATPPKAKKAPKAKASASASTTAIEYEEGTVQIPLDEIEIVENTTRPEGVGSEEDITEFAATIKAAGGQQVPIVVQRSVGGPTKYRLAAGFRRVAALRKLGTPTALARVLVSTDEKVRVLANLTENENARKDITPLGRVAGYERNIAEGMTIAEVALVTGRAEDFIRDHLRISKGADEIRAALAIAEGEPGSCSWAVARLILRFPKGEQAMLLKKVGHLSVEKARKALAEYRDAKSGKNTASDDGEGEGADEGEGSGEGSKGSKDDDKVLSEAKVAKATVAFQYGVSALVAELRESLNDPKALEKHINTLAKMATRQEIILSDLLSNKVFRAEVKKIEDAAK